MVLDPKVLLSIRVFRLILRESESQFGASLVYKSAKQREERYLNFFSEVSKDASSSPGLFVLLDASAMRIHR